MVRSKGQGATEYLVILGAVLLVAMVVIALLGWFPQVGGPGRERESESYWKTANGIRLTGMPGYRGSLSDEQLWQVSQFLATADKLPQSVRDLMALPLLAK